jgi:UDP-N-acetylglucosamine--N-acetylmuramyl-(pentapeptide) pyrophosphoryl-undecaprenol N-acetylglucosamine transferase
MKIVFTGGGTGGHFYPLIAVAEAIHAIVARERLLEPQLFYIAPTPYDEEALFQNDIAYIKGSAGKVRRYASIANVTDFFRTGFGVIGAFFTLLRLYPDVVFSKGGYASVPTVIAAHLLHIPIVIHESDSKPGRANLLAAKYATRIAITFESSIAFFPKSSQNKIARTGIPVRAKLSEPLPEGAAQELGLDLTVPTVFIIGGSTGSVRINELILSGLPDLVASVNVIHQTGKVNYEEVKSTAGVILANSPHKERYHVFPYLSLESIRRAAGAATVIVSRAGSTSITEISLWGKPAILIPIPENVSHDQRTNAYAYARTGAAVVLEEDNMTPHILVSEIKRISMDPVIARTMGDQGKSFANAGSAELIASELLAIGLSHEPTDAQKAGKA